MVDNMFLLYVFLSHACVCLYVFVLYMFVCCVRGCTCVIEVVRVPAYMCTGFCELNAGEKGREGGRERE